MLFEQKFPQLYSYRETINERLRKQELINKINRRVINKLNV